MDASVKTRRVYRYLEPINLKSHGLWKETHGTSENGTREQHFQGVGTAFKGKTGTSRGNALF